MPPNVPVLVAELDCRGFLRASNIVVDSVLIGTETVACIKQVVGL